MAWYSAGTVSVTNGSATVTGSGTAWVANAQASEGIWLPDGRLYEIVSINSDTSLTISPNYLGTTQSGQDYRIIPVKGYPLVAAQQMASLISTVQGYVDGALSGRFGDGTVGAPGVSFASNTAMGIYRVAANQLGFVTNGVRRMLLTNTAMEINVPVTGDAVQSDADDATAGKLLPVGAFGLGGHAADRGLPPGDDLDNATLTGWYDVQLSTLNSPLGGQAGVAYVAARTAQRRIQTVYRIAGGSQVECYSRVSYGDGTVFGDWTPDSPPERGSNANGDYVKFADGTMICWHRLSATVDITVGYFGGYRSSGQVWNFPSAFVSSPQISFTGTGGSAFGGTATSDATATGAAVAWTAISSQSSAARKMEVMAIGRWY